MTRAFLTGIALIALLGITGCAQSTHEPEREDIDEETTEVEVEAPDEEIAYEFEPYSTLDEVIGWPASASTAAYVVSVPVGTECHWLEATSLSGPAIADTIDFEQPVSLDGLACGITPTPLSDRDDVVDEVARRVDEGMADLVAVFAATAFPDDALDCEPVDVPALSPGLSVKYLDSWYVVRPAAPACPETVAQISQGVAVLHLTEVLRHTTTYDDYVARRL